MRFAGQVKKTREAFWTRLGFVFFSQVVMATAAVGHSRTPSLARKTSPGFGLIQEPRMGILRNTQKKAEGP